MSAERVVYLDSSALVKLVVLEPESAALRRYISRRRQVSVSSALSRTEVLRALLHLGPTMTRRAREILAGLELVRVSDRILNAAGELLPADLRSLDAIHLATALELGGDLNRLLTYDERMAGAAKSIGLRVAAPS